MPFPNVSIQYCNAALARTVNLQYDPNDHTIDSGSLGSACADNPRGTGTVLYTQVDGGITYRVRVQNTSPYAYVTAENPNACLLTIEHVAITDASTNQSSDGGIAIAADGNGVLSYSINNGITYKSSNVFTNLGPGLYKVKVRNVYNGNTCYATANAYVEYNAVVCELELGNITTVSPTGAGNDGSISINTLVNPANLGVEYRLDAGAWQDSPVFTGLSAATYNVQVRYKGFTSCSDNRDVEVQALVTCDIFIQTVVITHEQNRFGDNGSIEILATSSNGAIEYSIDDGDNYQESNIFGELEPGSYIVKIRDEEGCIDSQAVELLPYKAPYVKLPIINSSRLVLKTGPGISYSTDPQTFDNKLFRDMRFPGVTPCEYFEKRTFDDAYKYQFRSNYTTHTLKVYDRSDDSQVDALVVEQVKDFTRQTDELPCYLVDAGSNRTQIFFPSGLPDWAEVGQSITLDGTGHGVFDGDTFEIVEINAGTLLAEGFPVMIIAATFPTTGTIGGTLTAEYDIEPFDVWEFEINWGDYEAGKYYMILEGEDPQFDPFTAESEPIELAADHPDTILFRHRNTENAKQIFYDTGIEHVIRMEGELSRPQPGGEEVNHEDSQYRFIKLQENVTRNPMLHVADVTPYLAEKLSLICSQDYVEINGAEYGKQDEKVEVEYFDTEALCNARIKLRQVDFVAENSDDTGDVDNPTLLNVNGVLLSVDPELP